MENDYIPFVFFAVLLQFCSFQVVEVRKNKGE